MRSSWSLICLLIISSVSLAQDTLTLQSAIDIALRNNLQIEISRNDYEIAQNNNYAGNAGMLPSVAINASDAPASSNINQQFTNGTSIQKDNVGSNNINASLALSMVLFDGGRMFATKARLEELEALGENTLKANIQNIVSAVVQSYTNIVTQEKYLLVLEQLSSVSAARFSLVESRMDAGLANNTDLFLAQLDMNTRTQSIPTQQASIQNARTDLNVLLNFPADTTYLLQQQLPVNASLDKATLDALFKNNPEYLAAENRVNVALQAEKEIGAARFPRVGLTAAYGYSRQQSQAGFTLYSQSYGPTGSVTLSIPLFSGLVNSRNYTNAKIQHESAELAQAQTINSLAGSFEKAWQLYTAALQQVEVDIKSVDIARQYMMLMEQRYNLGQSTVIDFREAQRSFEETNFRLINNQYLLKVSETDLLRLTGQLVK